MAADGDACVGAVKQVPSWLLHPSHDTDRDHEACSDNTRDHPHAQVVLALEALLLLSDAAGVDRRRLRRALRFGGGGSSSMGTSDDDGPAGSSEEAMEGVVGFLAGVVPPAALQMLGPGKVRAALEEVRRMHAHMHA